MFKLYKKDGSEVIFSTEEGMNKTLKAFPDKYTKAENKIIKVKKPNPAKQETPEPIIDDVPVEEIPDGVTVESMEIEEKTEAAE